MTDNLLKQKKKILADALSNLILSNIGKRLKKYKVEIVFPRCPVKKEEWVPDFFQSTLLCLK